MSQTSNGDMQGFYVSMDYHNIAPDAIVSNYTVRWHPPAHLCDLPIYTMHPAMPHTSVLPVSLTCTAQASILPRQAPEHGDMHVECASTGVRCSSGGQACVVQEFIGQWVSLLTDVLAAVPEAKGRLLLDMINEPDGYGFKW